jgi:hypothetical protein
MSRAFLILTTWPATANTDPSERDAAVLAARREATVDAQVAWPRSGLGSPAAAGHLDAAPDRVIEGRTVFGFVDRLGRLHTWPGLRGASRAR